MGTVNLMQWMSLIVVVVYWVMTDVEDEIKMEVATCAFFCESLRCSSYCFLISTLFFLLPKRPLPFPPSHSIPCWLNHHSSENIIFFYPSSIQFNSPEDVWEVMRKLLKMSAVGYKDSFTPFSTYNCCSWSCRTTHRPPFRCSIFFDQNSIW